MKPILFSTPMVQAILEGRKTQTRRVVKPQPIDNTEVDGNFFTGNHTDYVKVDGHSDWARQFALNNCPYGRPGDVLWVRETWAENPFTDATGTYFNGAKYIYKATEHRFKGVRWRPSIHMPKEACRIFLKISDVRVERLQDIGMRSSIREGIEPEYFWNSDYPNNTRKAVTFYENYMDSSSRFKNPIDSFRSLWKFINGAKSWEANPWVWVVSYERNEKGDGG